MHRSTKFLAGFVTPLFVLGLAAGCSSSDKTTPSPTVPTVAGSGAASGGVAALPTACSLATDDQVEGLIGSKPAGAPTDHFPYYKTCEWTTSSGTILNIGVIRIGGSQVGFESKVLGLTATQIPGLGSEATLSVGKSSTGSDIALLVTKKGSVSLSVGVNGAPASSGSKQKEQLTEIANDAFTKLGV